MTQVYKKGITVDSETLATFKVDWHPDDDLPKWAVTINPDWNGELILPLFP